MTASPLLGRLQRAAGLATCLLLSAAAWSHGSMTQPASRASLCASGGNSNCGAIQYEPQSLEGPNGYPGGGAPDGQLASAGLAQFAALDEQTSSRWLKRPMTAGTQTFGWTLTANHVSRGFRYYITRQDWNPNVRLSRASFDATPFCQIDSGMQKPPSQLAHSCQVPARSGYQVILGIWDIGDTGNSFYQVVDVLFQGGPTPPVTPAWVAKGSLFPSIDLLPGDQVATRVFDSRGERADLQTRLAIASAGAGLRNSWTYLLAGRINAEQTLLRAGQPGADGSISPVQGQNEVYAQAGSDIQRVEVQITKASTQPPADLLVSGLASSYAIVNGRLSFAFNVTAVGEIDAIASLFDGGGRTLGVASASLSNSGQQLVMQASNPQPGPHQLVVKGTVRNSGLVIQKTYPLAITGSVNPPAPPVGFDYRFPDSLALYKAGTLVLQPRNGRIYECKPFPFSGFCVQWSSGATQFEPGVGSNWQDAWIAR